MGDFAIKLTQLVNLGNIFYNTLGSTNDGIPEFADFTGFNNPPPSGPVIPPVAVAPPPAPIILDSSSQPFSIDMQFAAFSQPLKVHVCDVITYMYMCVVHTHVHVHHSVCF